MRHSIQDRILASGAALLIVIGLFMFWAIRFYTQNAADEAFDRVLGAAALTIADTIEMENGIVSVDLPHSAFAILGTSRLNRVFYRIVAPDGSLVTGSPILGLEIPQGTEARTRFLDSSYRGEPVRVAAVARHVSDWPGGGWVDILVGETREAREDLSWRLALNAIWPVVGMSVLAFALIGFAVRSAFWPLKAVERALQSRSAADLDPIRHTVPREVSSLVVALNEFMARLNATLTGMRGFTADAAHQLRTPLMAMRALAEVALDEVSEPKAHARIQRIHRNAVSVSNLANQLLSDATTFHSLEAGRRELLDLGALVANAIERAGIETSVGMPDIEWRMPEGPIVVRAEPVATREMIRNLVDNAIVHAGQGVRVELETDGEAAIVRFLDRGPGIPAGRRGIVFERFAKGSDTADGSGLGLAIARAVIEAHGGTIALSDRPGGGLIVTVALPLHDPRAAGLKDAVA